MKKMIGSCGFLLLLAAISFAQHPHGPSCANDTISRDSSFVVVRNDGSACNHVIWTDDLYWRGRQSAIGSLSNSIMNNWYTVQSFAGWLAIPTQINKYLVVEKSLIYTSIFDSSVNAYGIIVVRVGIGIYLFASGQDDTIRRLSYHEFVSSDVSVNVYQALPGEMVDGALVRVECVSNLGKVAYLQIISLSDINRATVAVIARPQARSSGIISRACLVDLSGRIINSGRATNGFFLIRLSNGAVLKRANSCRLR
ncbi:MAG: hypothetical protein PHE24_02160 [Patescibacteria group bacterium]|nr:hypothetical protein [Patescibacteria group bacterium]